MPLLTNEDYLRKVPNDFLLTILVGRRVRELRRGGRPLIDTSLKDAVEIAFEEIRQGKIEVKLDGEEKPTL